MKLIDKVVVVVIPVSATYPGATKDSSSTTAGKYIVTLPTAVPQKLAGHLATSYFKVVNSQLDLNNFEFCATQPDSSELLNCTQNLKIITDEFSIKKISDNHGHIFRIELKLPLFDFDAIYVNADSAQHSLDIISEKLEVARSICRDLSFEVFQVDSGTPQLFKKVS